MKISPAEGMPLHSVEKAKEEHPEIREVSRQFESVFVNQLVDAMRRTVVKGGLIPESQAERVYQSMLDSEYSQRISETDQIGLSKMVYDHLLRRTEGQ